MTSLKRLVCLAVLQCLILSVPSWADVVTDWNNTTVQYSVPVRPGPSSILDLAMVHAAMHDAIQAYEHRYEAYAVTIPNATGSPVAAAASAAHDVLVNQFQSKKTDLDTLLLNYLTPLGLQSDPGIGIGQIAAAGI